jgi:pimeloyl-ACP methyl ester carboxylesterase
MGAVAAARAVHQYHLTPRALIIEMPYDRLLDAIRARVKMMGVPAEPAATLLAFYGGVEQIFWPFSHRTSVYLRVRSIPTLLQWGDADKRVSRSEINAISQSLTSAVQVQIYHGLGHESLHKKQPVKWRQAVLRFLDSLPPFH